MPDTDRPAALDFARLEVARCEIARLEDVIARQAATERNLRAACAEFETKLGVAESQLHTVDQQWGAIAEAVHDWEMGDLAADAAIRKVRDTQAPTAAIAGSRKAATA